MTAKKPSYETHSNPIPNVITFFFVLVMAGSLLRAEVTIDPLFSGSFTEVDSATQLNYAADVSSADLLHGLTATTTGWEFSAGATPANLNDGAHGTSPDVVGNAAIATVAWTTVGATAEYELGTGSNGTGYDITSIQSIADWGGAGFGNQGYTVEVKRVAGSYVTLATVDFQPLPLGGAGTTKVRLTGLDPSGIEFIRFTANSVNGGANVGAFTFREIDVLGRDTAALGPDSTPPTVSILSPVDDATAVLRGDNLVITFDTLHDEKGVEKWAFEPTDKAPKFIRIWQVVSQQSQEIFESLTEEAFPAHRHCCDTARAELTTPAEAE